MLHVGLAVCVSVRSAGVNVQCTLEKRVEHPIGQRIGRESFSAHPLRQSRDPSSNEKEEEQRVRGADNGNGDMMEKNHTQ